MRKKSDPYPWGIYIHVPWCHRRCSYCDFYIEVGKKNVLFPAALEREWLVRRQLWPKKPAKTLYFGGGTPSVLSAGELNDIICLVKRDDSLQKGAEITLECNPEDLSSRYLSEIKEAGVNRLSLGIQSFDNDVLRWLGRKHREAMARECLLDAVRAGFDRISVDLILGVPGENALGFADQVGWLREIGIGHISIYLLSIEANTPLDRRIRKGLAVAPDDDAQAQIYESMQELLEKAGFKQYEVASFAAIGQESIHNRIYWSKGSYLGLGPGAHSMRLHKNGALSRRHTKATLNEWLQNPADAPHEEEILTPHVALAEALAFGIRDLGSGVEPSSLAARHRCALPQAYFSTLAELMGRKWVEEKNGRIYLTAIGARFADAVARDLLAL